MACSSVPKHHTMKKQGKAPSIIDFGTDCWFDTGRFFEALVVCLTVEHKCYRYKLRNF